MFTPLSELSSLARKQNNLWQPMVKPEMINAEHILGEKIRQKQSAEVNSKLIVSVLNQKTEGKEHS